MKLAMFNEDPGSCILVEPLSLFPLFFGAGAALWNELAKSVYVLEVFYYYLFIFLKRKCISQNLSL